MKALDATISAMKSFELARAYLPARAVVSRRTVNTQKAAESWWRYDPLP
jgi:hypothetical protein